MQQTLIDLLLSSLGYYATQFAGVCAVLWVCKAIWEAAFFAMARLISHN